MSHQPPKAPTVVLHAYGRMDRGGAESRSVEMLAHVDPARIHSIYAALSPNLSPGSLDETIRGLQGQVIRCTLGKGFGKRFRAAIRNTKTTAMHGHVQFVSGLLCFWAWQEKVPVRIVHFHTTGEKNRPLPKKIQDFILARLADRFATHILSVGESAMASNWPKYKSDKRCHILFNGVDKARFDKLANPPKLRAELGIPEDAFVVVHVGRFHPIKNQKRLIEIFQSILKLRPNSRLILIGGGEKSYEDEVRLAVDAAQLTTRVTFSGVIENVASYLPLGDVMVMPSVLEGMPGAVLEALAAGVPVLASDVGGVMEIRGQLPGIATLSLDDSDERWASEAIALPEKYAQREELSSALFASHFSLEACIQGHVQAWENR